MPERRQNFPDVWGPGQLLAFSGIDGKTDETKPFVFHTAAGACCLEMKLPLGAMIEFSPCPETDFEFILGDAIAASDFRCAFLDDHTLIGQMPKGSRMIIGGKIIDQEPFSLGNAEGMEVFAASIGQRWSIFATKEKPAFDANLDDVIESRAKYVKGFIKGKNLSEVETKLLGKAVSVMKVNIESACGRIKRLWPSGDRWPHRWMWLWDSAFHGIGFAYVDPKVGQEIVLAMLEQVHPDGLLPITIMPNDEISRWSQPPVLAWSVLTILRKTNDLEWAKQCSEYLFRYLEWDRINRDTNKNDLFEWIHHNESGLDNSPRFDRHPSFDAVDFSCFMYNDYTCLAEIAKLIKNDKMYETCIAHAKRIAKAINELLWCPQENFYFDRSFEGKHIPVKAVSAFLPLFAGIADKNQADALRKQLQNPQTFKSPLPVPSVSLDSGAYCKDMWRGPTWINFNYMIYLGLKRYGFYDDAQKLKDDTLNAVYNWYLREGCLFEYYDSLDLTSPRDLDRKQRLKRGEGMSCISDYHWTAALVAAMILDET